MSVALTHLLQVTNNRLLIAVPYEEKAQGLYGHLQIFTPEKLNFWGNWCTEQLKGKGRYWCMDYLQGRHPAYASKAEREDYLYWLDRQFQRLTRSICFQRIVAESALTSTLHDQMTGAFTVDDSARPTWKHIGHYVAAKHGVIGLVKTLAMELAPYNINVNAICPTTVDTGIVNNQAFFEYFAGGPEPNANREYVIARMNEMNLFADRGMLAPEDVTLSLKTCHSYSTRKNAGCDAHQSEGLRLS